jgi:hypothetical protein
VDTVEKRKIFSPSRNEALIPRSSTLQPSHCSNIHTHYGGVLNAASKHCSDFIIVVLLDKSSGSLSFI